MFERANDLLRSMLGPDVQFREGQWEAIQGVLNRRRTLLVQRTGWGKSVVYFLATKLLRDSGSGPALLVSPLLSLMRNQIEMAERIGIRAVSINSANEEDWPEAIRAIHANQCDIILISPERLANNRFRGEVLDQIADGIGLFVVDEAHCISDWGHDFRPDYRRIISLIRSFPPSVPILATTATANNRVVDDIKEQIGDDLSILRGSLTRESLKLQVISLADQAERLAWLSHNLGSLPGSGIIYCLTVNDCKMVADWLYSRGYPVAEYYGDLDNAIRIEREQQLLNNDIKALVATVALGMGFDKPDLGFVVHYQKPGSPVSYYQQIGRAGRRLDEALVVLLCGQEDDDIHNYFIETAFPSPDLHTRVLDYIENGSGVGPRELERALNASKSVVEKCLKLMEVEGLIFKDKKYFRTVKPRGYDIDRLNRVTELRRHELSRMNEFVTTQECLMGYIARELDDSLASDCGKCANCIGGPILDATVPEDLMIESSIFLRRTDYPLEPRKKWPTGGAGGFRGNIPESHQTLPGKVLAIYGDAGWGRMVKDDKYILQRYRDELVDAMVSMIERLRPQPFPQWVTWVPSIRRPELVKGLAVSVAARLHLPLREVLSRVPEVPSQKTMRNSQTQAANAVSAYRISGQCLPGPVLLVDDMVDSRWTLTACGYLLRDNGSGPVIPVALASTAQRGDD